MNNRTLILHAGGSKTGSSAIQNFLELSSDSLRAHGFNYLNLVSIKSEYQIQSGNGAPLYAALIASDSSEGEIDRILLSFVGNCEQAICSSEFFSDMDAAGWRQLRESAMRLRLNLRIVLFVRNVIPFFQSAYDQAIKCHGEWRPFAICVAEAVWQHGRVLRLLAGEFAKSDIELVHYDGLGQHQLVERFLRVIGMESTFELALKDRSRRVNRSLTEAERDLLRSINRSLGPEYAGQFFEKLVRTKPECFTNGAKVDAEVQSDLLVRYRDDVDWINQNWFDGRDVVGVLPLQPAGMLAALRKPKDPVTGQDPEYKQGHIAADVATHHEDLNDDLLRWCVSKFQLSIDIGINAVVVQMRRIDWDNANHPSIPENFDPVAYLLLNIDVLKADSRPFGHYIEYGQFEDARPWEWQQL